MQNLCKYARTRAEECVKLEPSKRQAVLNFNLSSKYF
jgi:hypothetical protein